MSAIKPHYLLFCEGDVGSGNGFDTDEACRWRFILENVETGQKTDACDYEEALHPDRIALIAVIRGLEALDQPSKVTMITNNRYVARGLQYGLSEWRESDFCWEHFGSIQPIRNADLWRRVDIALRYHEVTCRWMSYDPQQDRYEGDRREVPVDTQLPAFAKSVSSVSHAPASWSEPSDRMQAVQSSPAIQTQRSSSSSLTPPENPLPSREHLNETLEIQNSSNALLTLCYAPIDFSWNLLLCIDSKVLGMLRSLCLIDPLPEKYKTKKQTDRIQEYS
jgi:ribonuclease HI